MDDKDQQNYMVMDGSEKQNTISVSQLQGGQRSVGGPPLYEMQARV